MSLYKQSSLGGYLYWELTNSVAQMREDDVRWEVGRFPMRTKTKCTAIKYWLKFCEPELQNKLSGIAFTDQIAQDKKELWPSKLKRLLNLAGLGDIWSAKTNTPATMSYIRQRLLDIEQQTWISEIHNDERKDPHQKKI